MRINTNVSALIANHNVTTTDNAMTKALERLSSGLKINRAEDDSAGIAVAKKLHTQIKCLDQTSRNGNDGLCVVQTAEGALSEVEDMLQRMRELAVQGATETCSDEDRESIQEEVRALKEEITRVASQTEYSSITLLDGNLDRRSYCTPTGKGEVINSTNYVSAGTYELEVTAEATNAKTTLKATIPAADGKVTENQSGFIRINGSQIDIDEGDTATDINVKLLEAASRIGATYDTADGKWTTTEVGASASIEIVCSNQNVADLFGLTGTANTTTGFIEVKKEIGTDAEITIKQTAGGFSGTATSIVDGNYITVIDNNGFSMKMKVSDAGDYKFEVTDMGTMPIQIGVAEGQVMELRIKTVSLEAMGISNTNCSTSENSQKAIEEFDKAISYISSVRGDMGAYQNRLEAAVSSAEITEQSTTEALSRIEDTDMAEEMTNYTQLSVLSQAGISVLAQANERPQMVLQLLQ